MLPRSPGPRTRSPGQGVADEDHPPVGARATKPPPAAGAPVLELEQLGVGRRHPLGGARVTPGSVGPGTLHPGSTVHRPESPGPRCHRPLGPLSLALARFEC